MGRAIAVSVALVLIVGIIALVVYFLNRKPPVGDLDRSQERELQKLVHGAAGVMRSLGARMDIDDSDVLSPRSTRNVTGWLDLYEKHNWEKRELNA